MTSGDIMRLIVVTVFCVFGTRGLTTRKLPATVTTMPATTHEARSTTGSVTTNATTNTTTVRPDGLLNKYDTTATASASSTASVSASAASLTNPPPLRQPMPEPLTAHGRTQNPIPSQPASSLHPGQRPNVIYQQNSFQGVASVGSVSDTLASKVSQPTPSTVVPVQTESAAPSSSASVAGAVYTPTTRPELTSGLTSVPNTRAEAPRRLSSAGSVGQHSVSGHPGTTATGILTSTAQSSAAPPQRPTPTRASTATATAAAAGAASPHTLTSSATGSSPAVTIIPYPCDGYNCPTDKPHCVLVRQQCKALRCPAVPTCAAVAPVSIQCLVGHPVFDDMFSALTCGPRGDFNCPLQSDCDETSGFATCCWTGSHGVNSATSKIEPTSYLLSAPKPRTQKTGDCPRPLQTGSCINVCVNDSSCAGTQICCSNGCGTACVDPVAPASASAPGPAPGLAPASEPTGACPVLGIGESCPSSTSCKSDSQCSYGSQCCFLSRTCRVCVNTAVGGSHASGKGSPNGISSNTVASSRSGPTIPGLFPSNDQKFIPGNSVGGNSIQRTHVTDIIAHSPVARQGGNFQSSSVGNSGVSSQGSVGISGSGTTSGMNSKAAPDLKSVGPTHVHGDTSQGSVVPQQQSGSGVGDLGRIRPGDLIVDILNNGANGPHAVISGMTNSGIVQLGRHRIGSVNGSAGVNGTNGISNGPSNSVTANEKTMAVSNLVATALAGPSLAANSASAATSDIGTAAATGNSAHSNVGGTGTTGGVVSDTSGSTVSAKGASSQSAVVDQTLPTSLDSLNNAQGSSSININNVNSGTRGNVVGDIPLGGAISGSEASVAVTSGLTASPVVDAGPSAKGNSLGSTVVGAGGSGAAGFVGDIASGGGISATLGGTDNLVALSANSVGVSSNAVGTVLDAPVSNGIGILNSQLVNAAGNSGIPSTGQSPPGITNLDTSLATGTVVDQGITGNGQVVGLGTGDLGTVVLGHADATGQSVILPQSVPDLQGGLSQVVIDGPVGVPDVLGGNVVVGANAVGGVSGVNTISPGVIGGTHAGILGTATDQQGSISNNPSGILTGGIGATDLTGNGALSGTIDATGIILAPEGSSGLSGNANAGVISGNAPSGAAIVNTGSNSNTLQNGNRDNLGASGSLLSNGITPSGSGSSRSFQTARGGSLSQPSQPRFQVEIETTHFGPHLHSGRRVSNVGGASARRKHTSTSVKIGGGSNHFSTSVNIGHGSNSRQEVKINHNVAGRNGRLGGGNGNSRLQTHINIGSSPEISKTPRSPNYRRLEPLNSQTSRLPGASSVRGVATAASGSSDRIQGITGQVTSGSRPSYLASGSGNSLRSSALRSAAITKSDPFVRPRPSSLSRSTIAGSAASRAIAAGNVVVNGGVSGIRGISGNPSRNTARSSPGVSGILLNRGAPRSVSDGHIGIGTNAAPGSNILGLSEQAYGSATSGQYPVPSGGRLAPSARNQGAAHFDVLGSSQSRPGAETSLSGLSLVPPGDILPGSIFEPLSSLTDPQGNTALIMSPRINNAGSDVPATYNVPPSSPLRSPGADLSAALKPSAFPLPTSYDATAAKPGFCLKPCGFALCINECSNDNQCPGSQKCCSSGCGRVCTPPFPYFPTVKPGVCPSSQNSAVCTGGHSCNHDGDCAGSSKCCCVGSGCRVCVLQGRILPKMVPGPVLARQTLPQFGIIGKGYVWR